MGHFAKAKALLVERLQQQDQQRGQSGLRGSAGQFGGALHGFYKSNPWITEHTPGVVYLARDWNKWQSAGMTGRTGRT